MQAQEYEHAKWAVGVRVPGVTEPQVEHALATGAILRTHPMRGTHHFVARADMRWLMALMGPLMIGRSARRNRELGLDERTLTKGLTAIARALEGGNHLARNEIAAVLSRARISSDGQRLAHIIYRAELEALVCSGKRKGKHITLALFDERVPPSKPRSRDDSLRELALRYFVTRGPATLADFIWWCQLPAADAREGLRLAGDALATQTVNGVTYYLEAKPPKAGTPARALLLPPYDEYTVAYKDRSAAGVAPAVTRTFGEMSLLAPNIVVDGKVVGTWRRTLKARRITVELAPWTKLSPAAARAVQQAVKRYQAFVAPNV